MTILISIPIYIKIYLIHICLNLLSTCPTLLGNLSDETCVSGKSLGFIRLTVRVDGSNQHGLARPFSLTVQQCQGAVSGFRYHVWYLLVLSLKTAVFTPRSGKVLFTDLASG